jgi:hypothetical protein
MPRARGAAPPLADTNNAAMAPRRQVQPRNTTAIFRPPHTHLSRPPLSGRPGYSARILFFSRINLAWRPGDPAVGAVLFYG